MIEELSKISEYCAFAKDAPLIIIPCFKNNEERKSIPFAQFEELGREIKRGYSPRLNYLEYVDEIHRNS